MYKVIFDPVALAFLEKIERKIAERIWKKILSTKENPLHFEKCMSFLKSKNLIELL